MESNKRSYSEIDPDYIFPDNAKISRFSECQTNSEKLTEIVKQEFNTEIQHKERELEEIEDRLKVAMKTLQLLRSVCVSTYYNRNELIFNTFTDTDLKLNDPNVDTLFGPQSKPHPAVRKIIGKAPLHQIVTSRTRKKASTQINLKKELNTCHQGNETTVKIEKEDDEKCVGNTNETISHETTNETNSDSLNDGIGRNERFKTKYRIIVGNISKWLDQSRNMSQDKSTHKWMVYVRGPRENPNISSIIKKVRFFLHPSYRPNDIIEIKNSPFHLSRRGWGEFPLRAQIHFSNEVNKPIDVIHNLKLDTSHTGLETLGAETLIDVWLYTEPFEKIKQYTQKNIDQQEVEVEYINLNDDEELSKDIYTESSSNLESNSKNETNNVNIIENNVKCDNSSNFSSFSDIPSQISLPNPIQSIQCTPTQLTTTTTTTTNTNSNDNNCTDRKIYVKDGKICVIKNKSRSKNFKNKISLLKSCVISKQPTKNDCDMLTIVTVRTINEIHDYCKKINDDDDELSDNSFRTKDYFTKFLINFTNHNFYNVNIALLYLLRHLPLITEHAYGFLYLQTFPYVAKTVHEFLSWNKVKQFCAEWYRAKYIKNLLIEYKINGYEKWSTKSIVQYSRLAGFSINDKEATDVEETGASKSIPSLRTNDDYTFKTFAESIELQNWLRSTDKSSNRDTITEDIEIDVVNVESPKKENKIEENQMNLLNIYQFPEDDLPKYLQNNYVKDITSDLGIKFGLDEITPNSWASLSEICVLVATKCFAEDLIRRSLICNSTTSCDKKREIQLTDVKSALQSRVEFDLFTNYGLGKQLFSNSDFK